MTNQKHMVGDAAYIETVSRDPSMADVITCKGIKNGSIALVDLIKVEEPVTAQDTRIICAYRVFGRPATVNTSVDESKSHWNHYRTLKSTVEGYVEAALRNYGYPRNPTLKRVQVDLEAHYPNKVTPDVDGVWVKPFLDAMQNWVYSNDRQVRKYSVEVIDDSPVSAEIDNPDQQCFVEVVVSHYRRRYERAKGATDGG